MRKYLIPESGKFYKANLHCHTNVSDGTLSPEETKKMYMEKGYSIVAFTDHDFFHTHNDLTDDNFLALNGYEMAIHGTKEMDICPNHSDTPRFGYIKCCHINMIASRSDISEQPVGPSPSFDYSVESIKNMMKKGKDAGFFVVYNHPTWNSESYPEYMGYDYMDALEMINYDCIVSGYDERNPRVYDDMLRGMKKIGCIATDDNHTPPHGFFGGYTMIKANSLDYGSVIRAPYNKNYYCSESGPDIKALYIEDGRVHIDFENARECFVTTAFRQWIEDRRVVDMNCNLTHHSFEMNPNDVYFRFTVVGKDGKCSYTNAYFYEDILKEL